MESQPRSQCPVVIVIDRSETTRAILRDGLTQQLGACVLDCQELPQLDEAMAQVVPTLLVVELPPNWVDAKEQIRALPSDVPILALAQQGRNRNVAEAPVLLGHFGPFDSEEKPLHLGRVIAKARALLGPETVE
jgi:hypothetical protein